MCGGGGEVGRKWERGSREMRLGGGGVTDEGA